MWENIHKGVPVPLVHFPILSILRSTPAFLYFTMSKLKWILKKLEVENEPGLSNAQLMLTNSDLQPGTYTYNLPDCTKVVTDFPSGP